VHILKVFLLENKINIKQVNIETPKSYVNVKVVCTLTDLFIHYYCFYQETPSVIGCLITKILKDYFEVVERETIVIDDVVKDVLMKN
jgi:hypothetical protein